MKRSVFWVVLLQLVPRHLSFLWQAFTTSCVKMATPIHFIDGNCCMKLLKAGKSRKTCLTNRTWSISHHITPLVINGLGGRHTDRQTHTHAYRHANQNNFKKPGARGLRLRAPGLKMSPLSNSVYSSVFTYNPNVLTRWY